MIQNVIVVQNVTVVAVICCYLFGIFIVSMSVAVGWDECCIGPGRQQSKFGKNWRRSVYFE